LPSFDLRDCVCRRTRYFFRVGLHFPRIASHQSPIRIKAVVYPQKEEYTPLDHSAPRKSSVPCRVQLNDDKPYGYEPTPC